MILILSLFAHRINARCIMLMKAYIKMFSSFLVMYIETYKIYSRTLTKRLSFAAVERFFHLWYSTFKEKFNSLPRNGSFKIDIYSRYLSSPLTFYAKPFILPKKIWDTSFLYQTLFYDFKEKKYYKKEKEIALFLIVGFFLLIVDW